VSSTASDILAEQAGLSHPRDVYQNADERHAGDLATLRGRFGKVETGRVVTFLIALIVGLLYKDLPLPAGLSLAIAATSLAVFMWLVVRHRRLRRAIDRVEAAQALARLGALRLARRWSEMADVFESVGYDDPLLQPEAATDESHPYVADLDLFGPASVRALLGLTPTPTGVATLRAWLSTPAPVAEVQRRQSAVRSLTPDFGAREALAVEGLLVEQMDLQSWTAFLEWINGLSPRLPGWAVHVAHIMPPITLGLFAYYAVTAGTPAWIWALPAAVQCVLAWRWGLVLSPYVNRATSRSSALRRHHPLFAAWEEYGSDEPSVQALQLKLRGETGVPASREIRLLERWLDAAESRASMFYPLLAGGLFWDVHIARGLERWRDRAGARVEAWFDALGELEAIAALATLAHDHPEWCWPDLDGGVPALEADALGHPLLTDAELKTSDVRLESPGRFLLITGSNMSGKSTLMRSIGLMAVMAQAGSVVCARRATLTPLRTFTSMRIHDSLTGGVSLFMAELLRLKALVDAADCPDGEPALLYLIDEVLQGTNSEERRVAARRIVSHLLDANAIGAVTTHDLSLHEGPRLDHASTKVHFSEVVGGPGDEVLTFDYVLRPGLATSRNALKLLRIVGLDDVGQEAPSPQDDA